jgi:hypothetical protein
MSPFDADTNVAAAAITDDGADDFRLVADQDPVAEAPVEPQAERVQPLSYINAPLHLIEAAMSCASTEETRYYLNGCFLHAHDGVVRVVSTDGHRLFIASFDPDVDDELPSWLHQGVIVPLGLFKGRFKLLKESTQRGLQVFCRIGYGDKAAKLEVTDYWNEIALRMAPVHGTFPDYNHVIGGIDMSGAEHSEPLDFVSFNQNYLKDVGSLATVLNATSVNLMRQSNVMDPTVITFGGVPNAALILMPLRYDKPVEVKTVALLAPAMKGTLAALRAHETRNLAQAENMDLPRVIRDEHLRKAADYAKRIQMILEGTTPRLAAPAPAPEATPVPEPVPEAEEEAAAQPQAVVDPTPDADEPAAEPTAAEPEAPVPSVYERTLSKRYRKASVLA